jgi:hypothetical protein
LASALRIRRATDFSTASPPRTAEAVVHQLEAIEIEDHHREAGALGNGRLGDLLEPLQRVAAVVEPCQRVEGGHPEPVAERAPQPVGLALRPDLAGQAQAELGIADLRLDEVADPHVERHDPRIRIQRVVDHQAGRLAGELAALQLGDQPERLRRAARPGLEKDES